MTPEEELEEMVTEQLLALGNERGMALIHSRTRVKKHLGLSDRWGLDAGARAITLSCYADGSGSFLCTKTLEQVDKEWRETDDWQKWKHQHMSWAPDVPLSQELESELSWLGRPRPAQGQV